jgi:hypothetical protein
MDKTAEEVVLCTTTERSEVQCNYENFCCSSEKEFCLLVEENPFTR